MSFSFRSERVVGVVFTSAIALVLGGCPMDNDDNATPGPTPPTTLDDAGGSESSTPDGSATPDAAIADGAPTNVAPTHSGLVSIQDISIANLPAAGHGLTVNAFFTPLVSPDFIEDAGQLTGCRAWSYDMATKPPPPEQDHGELRIQGTKNNTGTAGALACRFVPQRGYVCPTAAGAAQVAMAAPSGATTTVSVVGGAFAATDVGRYLQVSGATAGNNNGAFAIVGVTSPTDIIVANPRATAETFAASYTVLAGAGPTPNDLYDPFTAGTKVVIGLVPGGAGATAAFAIPDTAITPGEAFVLDDASKTRITSIPVTGEALTLSCGTASCGVSDGSIVRITATDADVTIASPVAMPPAKKKLVEIQCLRTGPGSESITVPAGAMDLLRAAHALSPITRIRTAFMRDGLAIATNKDPKLPPNTTYLATGHGVLGFTKP